MHKTVKDKYLLQLAVRKGLVKVVNKLIAAGIDVNQSSEDGVTPLFIAALIGHIEVVLALIAANSDVNLAESNGVTPLLIAACKGHHEVVAALITAPGIMVNQAENNGVTPLLIAACKGQHEVVAALITAPGIIVNQAATDNGITPLYSAAHQGHHEVVAVLITAPGIMVNQARTDSGATPLYVAAQNGHLAVVAALIAAQGIMVNQARTDSGATPLYTAAQNGHQEVVSALITAPGIMVNQARTDNGITPLYAAAQQGHQEVVAALIVHDANVDIADNNERTVFHSDYQVSDEIKNTLALVSSSQPLGSGNNAQLYIDHKLGGRFVNGLSKSRIFLKVKNLIYTTVLSSVRLSGLASDPQAALPFLPFEIWLHILDIASTFWLNKEGKIDSPLGIVSEVVAANPALNFSIKSSSFHGQWPLTAAGQKIESITFKKDNINSNQ